MATFQIWRNGGVENNDDYYDIPPDYDNIMRAEFDLLEPEDGDEGVDTQDQEPIEAPPAPAPPPAPLTEPSPSNTTTYSPL